MAIIEYTVDGTSHWADESSESYRRYLAGLGEVYVSPIGQLHDDDLTAIADLAPSKRRHHSTQSRQLD